MILCLFLLLFPLQAILRRIFDNSTKQKREMQRIVIVLTLLACVASVHPDSPDFETKKKQSTNGRAPTNTAKRIDLPASNDNNSLLFWYPFSTFSDYASNAEPKHESPKALVLQKTVPWTPVNIVSSLMPIVDSLTLYTSRAAIILLEMLMVAFLGAGITSLVCTYTTVCSVLGFNGDVKELARLFITPERLAATSLMVSKAIDKYSAIEIAKETNVNEDVTEEEEELTEESTTQAC
ncbi:uncharacterized protein LOC105276792 isoform X1 [Ooceraea biroi]|uniref:uncharacterized protein LOC105276792 isoform X1 n=2 Tax=Ooceraea biroi TaxID=2015173 RepID=UPI0009716393|nr:uncharacterized protein LOC105276792 isoform X1 [Ooceraea biroi]